MITKDNTGFRKMLDDFAQKTETKEEPALPPPPPPPAVELPPPPPNAPPEQEEVEIKPMSEEKVARNANLVLSGIDVAQKKAFGWGLEKKKISKITNLYGGNAVKDLENLLAKTKKSDNPNLTADELGLLGVHERAGDILKDFPLTLDEKEALRPYVEDWVKGSGGEIPDGFWAMAAVFGIFGGRLMNITQL